MNEKLMNKIHRQPRAQRGAVLVVALLMLLVLTTLGVATISSTNINLQLVQSQQRQQETEQVAENAINYLLSDVDYYENNSTYLDGNGDFTLSFPSDVSNGMDVTINSVKCIFGAVVPGDSLGGGATKGIFLESGEAAEDFGPGPPKEYYWETNITVIDSSSGASSTFIQGFKFKYNQPADCPV